MASAGLQLSVHALMNLANPIEGALTFGIGAECQGEHGVDGVIEAGDGGPCRRPEAAVFVDAGGNEWMRELQEDGTAPAEQGDALGVDAPRDGIGGNALTAFLGGHDPVPRLSPAAGPLPLDFVSGRVLRCHIQPATPKIARPRAPRRIRLQPVGRGGDSISRYVSTASRLASSAGRGR